MGVVVAVILVLLVIASALAQDPAIFSWAYWHEGGTAWRSEVVRNLGLLAVGVIGVGFGIWRAVTAHFQTKAAQGQTAAATEQARIANEQTRLAQQGQFTERFSRAAEHLGSGQLPVRLGGIYALWRLAEDSPERDVVTVIDILCAFARNPTPDPSDPPTSAAEDEGDAQNKRDTIVRPDVQTIMRLLGDKKAGYRDALPDEYRLELWGANLTRTILRDADFAGANLTDAKLWGATLSDANLTRAELRRTEISGADFKGANLTHADLRGATLEAASLTTANLDDAKLDDANLAHADLRDASLRRAQLMHANLSSANLSGANLTGAFLEGAKLLHAQLGHADLTTAMLWASNLTGADLAYADLIDTRLADANLGDASLWHANLARADLTRANLTHATLVAAKNLSQSQLDSACVAKDGPPPLLDKGLKPPTKICPED